MSLFRLAQSLGVVALACAAIGLGAPIVVALPIPVTAPRDLRPSTSDAIGALLARQSLDNPQASLPVAMGLKLAEGTARTRFEIEFSDPMDVRVFTLSSPNRVVFDLPEVLWRLPADTRLSGKGAVKSYRYGLFRKGNSRFVVDLGRPVKVVTARMLPPEGGAGFRLEVELAPATSAEFLASTGWPEDAASPDNATATVAPARGGKRVVILDAGHGGIDPGTHGKSGTQEKELVLLVARELRKALEDTGRYQVQLTRESDVFIPLRERVNMARAAKGDLFISLHADSNERSDIRGASVYTLSEGASDRETAKLAEKENMSDVIAGVNLSGENSPVASILIDLAQRDTLNRSVRFAETLIGKLPVVTAVQPLSPHRSAGFAVLKAPDIPAVLIELGYLTNRDDETEMKTTTWRTNVSHAIALAIDAHFAAEQGLGLQQAANP